MTTWIIILCLFHINIYIHIYIVVYIYIIYTHTYKEHMQYTDNIYYLLYKMDNL